MLALNVSRVFGKGRGLGDGSQVQPACHAGPTGSGSTNQGCVKSASSLCSRGRRMTGTSWNASKERCFVDVRRR